MRAISNYFTPNWHVNTWIRNTCLKHILFIFSFIRMSWMNVVRSIVNYSFKNKDILFNWFNNPLDATFINSCIKKEYFILCHIRYNFKDLNHWVIWNSDCEVLKIPLYFRFNSGIRFQNFDYVLLFYLRYSLSFIP